MSLTNDDKKWVESTVKKTVEDVVSSVLDDMIIPQFTKIYEKQKEHDKKFQDVEYDFIKVYRRFDETDGTLEDIEVKLVDKEVVKMKQQITARNRLSAA